MPEEYAVEALGWDETPEPWDSAGYRVCSFISPPVGFFTFQIDSADAYGFYWPLGKEADPPVFAFADWQSGSLIPVNSRVERCLLCLLATEREPDFRAEELAEFRDLVESLLNKPQPDRSDTSLASDDFEQLLAIDPDSPFLLAASADVHLIRDELDEAERLYRASIAKLPDYTGAHFGLAVTLRRLRRAEETVVHLRQALVGPLMFWGESVWSNFCLPGYLSEPSFRTDWARKSQQWLLHAKKRPESLADDPFLERIGDLKLDTGVEVSDDYAILQQLIEEYVKRGQPLEAVRLWESLGKRASYETTSFRERLQLTPYSYGERLAELLQEAGLTAREKLCRQMLDMLEDPNSLYL